MHDFIPYSSSLTVTSCDMYSLGKFNIHDTNFCLNTHKSFPWLQQAGRKENIGRAIKNLSFVILNWPLRVLNGNFDTSEWIR